MELDSYMAYARRGVFDPEDTELVNDFIDKWHEGESELTLHDYLGMTWDEYVRYGHDATSMRQIIEDGQTDDEKRIAILYRALSQYSDPAFYHGIAIMADRPSGGFDEDFDDAHGDHDYGEKPGLLARRATAEAFGQVYPRPEDVRVPKPEPVAEEPRENIVSVWSKLIAMTEEGEAAVLDRIREQIGRDDNEAWNTLLDAASAKRIRAKKLMAGLDEAE